MLKNLVFFALIMQVLCGCTSVNPDGSTVGRLETYNHAMFAINDKIDKGIIRPVAKGYRFVTNEYVREKVSNFFHNLEEPIYMVNHLLQGEFAYSGTNLGRFVMNTTLGIGGLFDVAAKLDMKPNKTGFDKTLANWCVPDGPYVVLPILGPSTPRATVGWVADRYTAPTYWIAQDSNNDTKNIYYASGALKLINFYADHLTILETLEEGSVDYYEAIKASYLQNRIKINKCGKDVYEEPSYDFDMDMDLMDEEY